MSDTYLIIGTKNGVVAYEKTTTHPNVKTRFINKSVYGLSCDKTEVFKNGALSETHKPSSDASVSVTTATETQAEPVFTEHLFDDPENELERKKDEEYYALVVKKIHDVDSSIEVNAEFTDTARADGLTVDEAVKSWFSEPEQD